MFSKNLTTVTGNITPYMTAAIFYLIVTLPLIKIVGIVEKNLARSERGGGPRPKAKAGAGVSSADESVAEAELKSATLFQSDSDSEAGALAGMLAPFRTASSFGGASNGR